MNILIIGGTRGLGFELSKILVDHQHKVYLVGRNEKQLDGVVSLLGDRSTGMASDITKENSIKTILTDAAKKMGSIDYLVCSAGVTVKKDCCEFTRDEYEKVFNLNVWAMMELSSNYLDIYSNGNLLFVSSVAGWFSARGYGLYAASKHALNGWVKTLRIEKGDKNSIFNVHPFRLNTNFSNNVDSSFSKNHRLNPYIYANLLVAIIEGSWIRRIYWWVRSWGWWIVSLMKSGLSL